MNRRSQSQLPWGEKMRKNPGLLAVPALQTDAASQTAVSKCRLAPASVGETCRLPVSRSASPDLEISAELALRRVERQAPTASRSRRRVHLPACLLQRLDGPRPCSVRPPRHHPKPTARSLSFLHSLGKLTILKPYTEPTDGLWIRLLSRRNDACPVPSRGRKRIRLPPQRVLLGAPPWRFRRRRSPCAPMRNGSNEDALSATTCAIGTKQRQSCDRNSLARKGAPGADRAAARRCLAAADHRTALHPKG